MISNIRISHPSIFKISNWSAPGEAQMNSGELNSWTSGEKEDPGLISCISTFEEAVSFNCIEIEKEPKTRQYFPNTFRFEVSLDGKIWEPILQEANFSSGTKEPIWHFPLVKARYLKILILNDRKTPVGKYLSAFGRFEVKISGLVSIEASSEIDRLWVKENLIDSRPDYGWSSIVSKTRQNEFLSMDLGSVNEVNEIRLLSSGGKMALFPERFGFSYSEDNISWHHLIEENGFLAEQQTWYTWKFLGTNMRYLRIDITEGARNRDGKYVSQLIEVELYAVPGFMLNPGSNASVHVQHASSLRAGIIRLGMDGENREGVVVQGNDRRLNMAQEGSPGIVELASNGEQAARKVVQADDKRLRIATEDLPGIVRLARNGEQRQGHVVQGNDERLQYATPESAGLVELALDGENRAGVVVQSSDSRLKPATHDRPGIVTLAQNNSSLPNEVVQGDDFRLRNATTQYPGIMQFAAHKNKSAMQAVQSDDPRIGDATNENSGIVKLARDGESTPGTVVDASDSRLQPASQENAGVVRFVSHGNSLENHAVQANDPRLNDSRKPLDHQHDYAAREHGFNEHEGTLLIKARMGEKHQSLTDIAVDCAPMVGINQGKGAGLAGKGADGVAGHGDRAGVLGVSTSKGVGVQGLGRFQAGGYFISEKNYALVAGGSDDSRNVDSSQQALLARGQSRFNGSVFIEQAGASGICLAMYFPVSRRDVLSAGDLVVIKDDGQKLSKSKAYGSSSVVGVIVNEASLVLSSQRTSLLRDDSGLISKPADTELVAISGIVEINVHVEKNRRIEAGDLLVASSKPGYAEKLNPDKYKPGIIIGRSMESLKNSEARLMVQLAVG